VDIGGSPFKLTVDPGPTHANGCSASGPGITGGYTGIETSFVLQVRLRLHHPRNSRSVLTRCWQARDYYGNNRTTGGDVFNIDIGGTAAARLRVRDNDNGTYTVCPRSLLHTCAPEDSDARQATLIIGRWPDRWHTRPKLEGTTTYLSSTMAIPPLL
jgi:hypothetical protein